MFHFKPTNRRFRVGEALFKRGQLEDAHLTNDTQVDNLKGLQSSMP